MLNYSKVATLIDDVADKLQEMGYTKEAEQLDIISNTIESMDPEAGWKDVVRKGLAPAVVGLSMLGAPAQGATEQSSEFAPTTQAQMENLKKTDPRSYKILKDQEEQRKLDIAQRMQARKPMGQGMETPAGKDMREVADRSIYTNPSQGPGEMELIKYKSGPGKSIGEAPSPLKGSGKKFFEQQGYIPQGK